LGALQTLQTISDAFAQEADEQSVKFRVGIAYTDGLEVAGEEFATLRDILATLEIGRITLEAVPTRRPPDAMKAISLRQPWADWVVQGQARPSSCVPGR
jgi:hypothetical protein